MKTKVQNTENEPLSLAAVSGWRPDVDEFRENLRNAAHHIEQARLFLFDKNKAAFNEHRKLSVKFLNACR